MISLSNFNAMNLPPKHEISSFPKHIERIDRKIGVFYLALLDVGWK